MAKFTAAVLGDNESGNVLKLNRVIKLIINFKTLYNSINKGGIMSRLRTTWALGGKSADLISNRERHNMDRIPIDELSMPKREQ